VKPIEYEGDKSAVYSQEGSGQRFEDILRRRLSRRVMIKGAAASTAMVVARELSATGALAQDGTPAATPVASPGASPEASPVAMGAGAPSFEAIPLSTAGEMTVAAGHILTPFLKWGDPLLAGAPTFDLSSQTAAAQEMQIGYNCDWIGFLPLPMGSNASDHGLLVVNHEYTNPEIMFPGYLSPNPEYVEGSEDIAEFLTKPTQEIVDVELAAHGLSVVEIVRSESGDWSVVTDSLYNRRITATTQMALTGAAAGSEWLKSNTDATGFEVSGTLNNCAGGLSPWGTVISGEENFQQYFANLDGLAADIPVRAIHERYGLTSGRSERRWEEFYDRFDIVEDPNEALRHGWAVEFDPYDPASTPKKRTALGRNKHEGFTSAIAPSGQVAFYTGDDERFDYAYKFVTAGSYNPDDRAANMDLLDEGTLYVARFNEDGSGEWLPLIQGEGELTETNGFASQADVLVNTRGSADLLGATKMDRPEDFETNPVNNKVYLVLTNNTNRGTEDNPDVDAANPRAKNAHGHIIEITEDGDDHAATTFSWEIFILAGDPTDLSTYFGGYPKDNISAMSSPDNIEFDIDGNLWISTDGQPRSLEVNDGLYVVPVDGPDRGYLKLFLTGVPGGEVSGPEFTPDNTALFVSIQHPGEGGTFEEPVSLWPDGEVAPRPTVVLVTAEGGGRVGV